MEGSKAVSYHDRWFAITGNMQHTKLSHNIRLLWFGTKYSRDKSYCKCITFTISLQKQPPEVFCNKRCSKKFCKIHMKAPVPESFFWWSCKACNFIKKRLWQRCFPVNFAKFLRTPFVTEHLWTTASEPNSMKLHLWISEEHLSVLFYAIPFLVWKLFQGSKTLFW